MHALNVIIYILAYIGMSIAVIAILAFILKKVLVAVRTRKAIKAMNDRNNNKNSKRK